MDDMLLFGNGFDALKVSVGNVEKYVGEDIHLQLKPPIMVSTAVGVPFLGYRLKRHRVGLTGRSRNRFARKMSLYGRMVEAGMWTERQYNEHITPLVAFTDYAYVRQWRRQVVESRGALTA